LAVIDEGVHRQQLHGSHAQRLNVTDDFLSEPGVGAAQFFRHAGMQFGETFHVQLVEDRLIPGHGTPSVLTPPIEIRIDDDAFCHVRRTVALVERQIISGFHLISEHCRVPLQGTCMGARIGIKDELVRIKAVTGVWLVRTVHSVPIKRPRSNVRHIAMEDLIVVFRQFDPICFEFTRLIEKAELNFGGAGRKNCEVGP
jgi:hypothetical protein